MCSRWSKPGDQCACFKYSDETYFTFPLQTERAAVLSELRPLSAENRQYNEAFNEKLEEMKPYRNRLGKFRDENNAMRAESAGLCSSLEELEHEVWALW